MEWLRVDGRARQESVDRKNGIIRGVILAEEGPFKSEGRGAFDGLSLQQIVTLAAKSPKGLKSRFTHPDLSNDGLGKYLGRTKNVHRASVDREGQVVDVVRGDHHFSESSYKTPHGDLANYLMDLAEEDHEALGLSLVLQTDEEDQLDASGKLAVDEAGNRLPPLWRPTSLHAVDFVDNGDATNSLLAQPLSIDGLPDEVVRQAEKLLREQFQGRSRDFVEPRLTAWVERVLSHYWPAEAEDEVSVLAEDLRRRLKLKVRRAG